MKNENMDKPELGQERYERLCAYVFGELHGEERAAFERELMQSSELRAERAQIEATIGLVKRAIPDEGLSHAVRRDVLASARRSRFRFLSGRSLLTLAAAGVLLLGGALVVRFLARDSAPRGAAQRVVARLDQAGAANVHEDSREAESKLAEAPAEIDALKGLGYFARADESNAAVAPAPSSGVLEQLEALGYAGGEPEPATSVALGFPLQPEPSPQSVAEVLSANTWAAKAPAAPATPGSAEAPVIGSGAGRLGGRKNPGATGPSSPGAAGPSSPAMTTGTDGFLLAHGAALATPGAKDKGTYKGAGDTVPPGGGGRGEEVAGLERLLGLGYVGGGDDDQSDNGRSHLEDRITTFLQSPSEAGRKPVQTREQVAVQVQQLLDATRPAPDESPRDMFFRYWGDAPFVLASEEHTSTFAVDVDTASYALARSYLIRGLLPPREAVRTEEFVNYFKADQAPPRDGQPFAIGLELAPSLFATDTRAEMLRVTVRAKDVADFERQPLALTFVIDNSGSMNQENRLALVKRSLGLLLRQLYAGDSVAVVKFSNNAAVVTPPLPAARRGELESAIQGLGIEGGTNVEAGLRLGYELASQNLQRRAVNRVILCSDGVGNIGETSSTGLLALVEEARAKGIYLNTVGVGMGNHNDAFLEQLADQGDGVCHYVDSDAEAKRVFVDGLASALQPVARDVKLQVEFDPAQVESWRLLGYENRALENRMFRDDAIDAGEVNAGHQVSALYELVRQPGRSGPLATVRLRYKPPFAIDHGKEGTAARAEAEQALELERTIGSVEARPGFQGTSGGYQRAVLVAQFAEVLRASVHARGDSLATLVQESRRLEGVLGDPDFSEFVALLAKANPLLDAKQPAPKVQALLDELALAHFELARGERMRRLDTDAAASPEELETRLGAPRAGLFGVEEAKRREDELRARIQRLEGEVRAELGQVYGLAPQQIEALKQLGYTGDK